jgi:hypothetical protein
MFRTMQEPLSELLDHLKAEIERAERGHADKDELARLVAEVERRLGEDDREGVVADLRNEAYRFEASHPKLAAAIGRTADALSAIGL